VWSSPASRAGQRRSPGNADLVWGTSVSLVKAANIVGGRSEEKIF
jgi:hypothetical protein